MSGARRAWRRASRVVAAAVFVIALGLVWATWTGIIPAATIGAGSVVTPTASASSAPPRPTPAPTPSWIPGGEQSLVVTARELPAMLTTAGESAISRYQRDAFGGWIDADGDGWNTRYEVLIASSTTPVTVTGKCRLAGGTWVSAMDGGYAFAPAQIEIDHHVPLAEAWRSGASEWSGERRVRFANDLDVPYALTPSTTAANQSKGDKDPARWMPSNDAHRCEYAITWALVKLRWSLTVDAAERLALESELAGECGAIEVELPPVV